MRSCFKKTENRQDGLVSKGKEMLSSKHSHIPQMVTGTPTLDLRQHAGEDLVWSSREKWAGNRDLKSNGTSVVAATLT